MRRLLVTRGLPGAGKSTALRELGLSDITLAADEFRLRLSGPVLGADGRLGIPQALNAQVWREILATLDARMERGETLVVDATHASAADFKPYRELAARHRYELGCLDLGGVPLEEADARNQSRAEWRRVPRAAMEELARRMADGRVPESVRRIRVDGTGGHVAAVREFLGVPMHDFSGCARVVHVGDIQGCATALREAVARMGGIRPEDQWIFVGDALDRGVENAEVMRWLLDEAIERPNVLFLWGNHEDHLHLEATGRAPKSEEFAEATLPQLRAAGIGREDLDRFCARLVDMVAYAWRGQRVLVTHGGLSTVPAQPWMLSTRQCSRGTGRYEDPVDAQFDRNAPPGWVQVHGHRNSHALPVRAAPRSFNLESAVEFGGQLRAAVLDASGWSAIEVANRVFAPFRERRLRPMAIVPPWMAPERPSGVTMAPELRAAMAAHPEVRERASAAFPHVVSLNFSKRVFYEASWDAVTVKARGLFVDRETGEIVARSYPKFFGLGERGRPGLEPGALRETLRFPLTGWLKENGFLGIVGYDRRTDALFVSSKSTTEGDFAAIARERLAAAIPSEGRRDALRRFLRDCEASIPMEVIDPVRDPHIIEYDAPKVVFLDVVRRSTEFERLPYEDLLRLGKQFGVEVKQKSFTLPDWQAFEAWLRRSERDMSRRIEGWVVEDASGLQFKVKTPYYAFWKLCRGMKEGIVREREGGRPARGLDPQFLENRGLGFLAPLAGEFRDWCHAQDTATLRRDIIALRGAFERATAPEPAAPRL